jgi:hypothetical protein
VPTTDTPDADLTPELIERVMKLSPENRDLLLALLDDANDDGEVLPHIVRADS